MGFFDMIFGKDENNNSLFNDDARSDSQRQQQQYENEVYEKLLRSIEEKVSSVYNMNEESLTLIVGPTYHMAQIHTGGFRHSDGSQHYGLRDKDNEKSEPQTFKPKYLTKKEYILIQFWFSLA